MFHCSSDIGFMTAYNIHKFSDVFHSSHLQYDVMFNYVSVDLQYSILHNLLATVFTVNHIFFSALKTHFTATLYSKSFLYHKKTKNPPKILDLTFFFKIAPQSNFQKIQHFNFQFFFFHLFFRFTIFAFTNFKALIAILTHMNSLRCSINQYLFIYTHKHTLVERRVVL